MIDQNRFIATNWPGNFKVGKNMKTNDYEITVDDIKEYLDKYSDFTFEMKVLKTLKSKGFECAHSGTYEDPITRKRREFDIQASKYFTATNSGLYLAVECKNITPKSPIVVQMVKREKIESFHCVICPTNPMGLSVKKVLDQNSLYKYSGQDYWVGKSFDQVMRNQTKGIIGNDEKSYDKFTQAINSASNLLQTIKPGTDKMGKKYLVVPTLVVPDERMWTVLYDENGVQISEPKLINHISYFINSSWEKADGFSPYIFSHLEIITYSEFSNVIDNIILNGFNVPKD